MRIFSRSAIGVILDRRRERRRRDNTRRTYLKVTQKIMEIIKAYLIQSETKRLVRRVVRGMSLMGKTMI